MLQRFVSGMVAMLVCAAVSVAQATMKVTDGVLCVGQSVSISYSDPSHANGTIVVTVDDGEIPNTTVVEVVIHLDSNGSGTANWTVPKGWWSAAFNAPDVREQTRAIR